MGNEEAIHTFWYKSVFTDKKESRTNKFTRQIDFVAPPEVIIQAYQVPKYILSADWVKISLIFEK